MSNTECRDSSSSSRSKTKSFDQCYKSYCKSKNISPMRNLIKNTDFVLDFCVDKIKFIQWEPILISIGDDISLECLSIRCRSPSKHILENIDSEMKARGVTKAPVILTRFMLWKLIDAVAQCLSQTPLLNILQIEGLPLPEPYIDLLTEALSTNTTLKYVGLNGCLIGDSGCQKVCAVLRNSNNVLALNLSGCNLTTKGVTYVADMINFLKIMRYSENWQHTLRYQSPDLDAMSGLRRVSLSDNPDIGDNGLVIMLEVLTDDLWIKAVDLQHCGITDNIVKDCVKFFDNNSCIQILDLRYNSQMTMKSYGIIMTALRKNECSSTKYSAWSLLSSHPVFRNNQKINTQKLTPTREKPIKAHFSSMSLGKYENNDTNTESIHIHILKEQLKNEMAMRRKLEELNVKLLQQVKELKANQIADWKAHMQEKHMTDKKGSETGDGIVRKKREIITINLNQEIEENNVEATPSQIIKKGNSNTDENKSELNQLDEIEEGTQTTLSKEHTIEKKKHHINLRSCSGANLLETLLQRRYESNTGNGHIDGGYTSEASSESSESTLCYLSGSSRSTVRHVSKLN